MKRYSYNLSTSYFSMVKILYGGNWDGASSTYAICTPVFASSSVLNWKYSDSTLYQMYPMPNMIAVNKERIDIFDIN